MPLLSTILTEKREVIMKLMSQFNFKTDDVLLLCHASPKSLVSISDNDELEHRLYFITDSLKPEENEETDESNYAEILSDMSSLEAQLSEQLDCDVGVLLWKNIQGLYWRNVLNHCAKISDQSSIKKLFNVDSLDKINIDPLISKDSHFINLKETDQSLPEDKSSNKNSSHSSLFKRKRSDSDETQHFSESSSESEKEELIDEKVKELENLPDQMLTEIWNRIQRSKGSKKDLSDANSPSNVSITKSTRVK